MIKKNQTIFFITGLAALMAFSACSSTEEKKAPEPAPVAAEPAKPEPKPEPKAEPMKAVERAVDPSAIIDGLNEKLEKVALKGMPPFKVSLGAAKMDEYSQKALEVSKSAIAAIPEGYVLQITGHSNTHPNKALRKGDSLSIARAKYVHDYFVKNGVPKEKISYQGVGSSEYDKNLSHADNRRVTFKLVKAQ
jgi:outer membrane protein OmpA-like peptidoglycan-associated protein